MEVHFPSIEDILRIHARVIRSFGGDPGLRDLGLLSSAAMVPQQAFGGQYAHQDLAGMAAAYLFHLARNHAFVDGNKRVAAATALAFLKRNGAPALPEESAVAEITLSVEAGQMSKEQLTVWMRSVVTGDSASG